MFFLKVYLMPPTVQQVTTVWIQQVTVFINKILTSINIQLHVDNEIYYNCGRSGLFTLNI